ncbi:hypothetical protein Tco_0539326 [Tanacetum coccineum]
MTESIGGSASGYISDSLYEHLRLKLHAASPAYEVKKEKELAYTECKELEFSWGKRMAKRAMMDLVEDDEEKEQTRHYAR